jgi:excisionase family DNA binding protein
MDKLAHSVDEAAEMLGISRWSVYRLVESGDLAKIPHLGRRVQVARVELERFAAQGVKAAS